MNSERLMNEQRLALLKTIRKENPSLRRYMNDIINEMENPESAFNTEKMTQPTDLDRTTAMRRAMPLLWQKCIPKNIIWIFQS